MTHLTPPILLGLAVGFLAGLSPSCGASKPCAETCAGCCDATGACLSGTSDAACGSAGSTCVACPAGRSCSAGFCSAATGGGAGGGNATGGGGGSSDGGGNTGGGTGGGAGTGFVDQLARTYCARSVACGFTASVGAQDCEALVRLRFADFERGGSTPVAAAAADCLARLPAATCAVLGRELSFCLDAYAPATATGGRCYGDFDCSDAEDRCAGTSCGRSCQALGSKGAPCRTATPACDKGLYCAPDTDTCQPTVPPGSACPIAAMCNGDGACSNGRCVALPAAGETCDPFNGMRCAESAYCSGLLCTARKAVGATCATTTECVVGTACVGGRCVTRGEPGATCATTPECADGLTCDVVLKQCAAVSAAVPRGGMCTKSTRFCRVDSTVCAGQSLAPDGSPQSAGTCRDSAVGDRCASSADCNAGTFCSLQGSTGASCQASSIGTQCLSAANCRPTEDCVQRLCQPRVVTNATCITGGPGCLDPAAVCVAASDTDLALACRRLAAPGAPCRTGAGACQFPAVCANGRCVLAGHPGQPCLPALGCLDGVCLDASGALATAPAGTCAPPRDVGSACVSGVNCASGTCDPGTGTCIAACR